MPQKGDRLMLVKENVGWYGYTDRLVESRAEYELAEHEAVVVYQGPGEINDRNYRVKLPDRDMWFDIAKEWVVPYHRPAYLDFDPDRARRVLERRRRSHV